MRRRRRRRRAGASQLHEGLGTDHVRHAVAGFVVAFFAIWWEWLNFTWFASAYDTAYDTDDEAGWRTALRHTLALTVIQIGWIVRLFTPGSWGYTTFAICAIAELSGPYWAEHAERVTTWHPQHIAEHHGLFTIIVLGECVHSAFVAINAARTSASGISAHLAVVAGAGLQCMFGVWWIYFQPSAERKLEQRSQLSFVWGYGHSPSCARQSLRWVLALRSLHPCRVTRLTMHHCRSGSRCFSWR